MVANIAVVVLDAVLLRHRLVRGRATDIPPSLPEANDTITKAKQGRESRRTEVGGNAEYRSEHNSEQQ